MKKHTFYSLFIVVLFLTFSCADKKHNSETTEKQKEVLKNYVVDTQNSVINWTAYKTTQKIPVKGVFKKVVIINSKPATSNSELLNGLEFEIPVASIFSKDSLRDYKLTTFFFGVMKNTLRLKGTINIQENNNGFVALTMNGLTKNMPFTYHINNNSIELNAVMNLDNWQAQTAVEALNKVCEDKHKAGDGISKTWSEVALNIQIKTSLVKQK